MACLGEKAGLLAAVEPDVEKVVHDFIVVEPVIRTKQRLVIGPEPRICAAGLERLNDAGVDLGIVQILAALAVHIQRDWHTPGPLAADDPVWTTFDHGTDAIFRTLRHPAGVLDGDRTSPRLNSRH